MSDRQLKIRLESLKGELEGRLERIHTHIHGKQEAVSADFHEQLKQTENDQLVYSLEDEGRHELWLVNQALARLASGEFGHCIECGDTISQARLEAIPYADLCIGCASRT